MYPLAYLINGNDLSVWWIKLVSCSIVGVYYIMLYGNSSFSGVTIKALNAAIPSLSFGIPVTNLTAGSGKQMLFKLVLPNSSYNRLLVISLFGGSGNADLFVSIAYPPTTSVYDWFSKKDNNEDEVQINYYSGMCHFV